MAPVPPLVAAAAVGTAKVVAQGVVFVGSSVAAVAAVKAMSDDDGVQQQNVTALLAHLEQKNSIRLRSSCSTSREELGTSQ